MASKKKVKKTKPPRPPHIAMQLPRDPTALHVRCLAILAAVLADPAHFGTPFPAPAQITADLTALGNALQAAEGGDPAAIVAVQVAAVKVRADFKQLGVYIEGVVRSVPPADAPALIANVLVYESKIGKRSPKPEIGVKQQAMPGTVLVTLLAVAHATMYYYDWSVDQASWTTIQSQKARLVISGLTPGKVYYFRFRAFTRAGGMGTYSQVVSLTVV
jgi:hypothetical protein